MNTADLIEASVEAIETIAEGVKCFTLKRRDEGLFPGFAAGANIGVEIAGGDGQFRNNYTLVSDPLKLEHYKITIQRQQDGRGGSVYLHDKVDVGAILHVRPPLNFFPIERSAKRHLLIAGGIGITPIFAMAQQLLREGAAFEVHYAARSEASAAYLSALAALAGRRLSFYAQDKGQRLDVGQLLSQQTIGTRAYVCGPQSLITDVEQTARTMGWPASAVLSEKFTADISGEAFEVELLASGTRLAVPEGVSLLNALEGAGVEIASLCRMGACGFCETTVLHCDGAILHRDHILSGEQRSARTVIYPCVSRFCGTRLCLDL